MTSFRREIHDFIRSSETILSPAYVGEPLTLQEAQIVKFYAISLSEYCDRRSC